MQFEVANIIGGIIIICSGHNTCVASFQGSKLEGVPPRLLLLLLLSLLCLAPEEDARDSDRWQGLLVSY